MSVEPVMRQSSQLKTPSMVRIQTVQKVIAVSPLPLSYYVPMIR